MNSVVGQGLNLCCDDSFQACKEVHSASEDLFLAYRFARHVSPLTTTIYTHPSDEGLFERVRSLAQPGGAFLHGLCRLKGSCSEGESVQFDENTIWTAGEENPGHQNPGPIHKTPILRGQNGRLTDEVNDLRLRWGDSLVNRLSARADHSGRKIGIGVLPFHSKGNSWNSAS